MNVKKSLSESIKGFLKMSGDYAEAAEYLAQNGYDDKYMELLRTAIEKAPAGKRREEGKALAAQGLLFKGDLTEAAAAFGECDIKKLSKTLGHVFVNNYILCLFLLERYKDADRLYDEHNSLVLGEQSAVMRRSVGIHEYIAHRYENAVTVFVKALSYDDKRSVLMMDICLVKAMLRLDMYDRAAETAHRSFSAYNGRGELTRTVKKLEMKIDSGARKKAGGKGHGRKNRKK